MYSDGRLERFVCGCVCRRGHTSLIEPRTQFYSLHFLVLVIVCLLFVPTDAVQRLAAYKNIYSRNRRANNIRKRSHKSFVIKAALKQIVEKKILPRRKLIHFLHNFLRSMLALCHQNGSRFAIAWTMYTIFSSAAAAAAKNTRPTQFYGRFDTISARRLKHWER